MINVCTADVTEWFASKKEMVEKHGLAYGLNLSTLYQSIFTR